MKISIAMAVFNGERFVREQLESFSQQTRLPDELVVSDDASSDRSVEIVRDFAAHASFKVKLLANRDNVGCTKNFERAIRECDGGVIFVSDWDDVWYPERIALTEQTLSKFPQAAVAVCRWQPVDEELRPIPDEPRDEEMWRSLENPEIADALTEGRGFNHWLPAAGCCVAFRARLKPLLLPFPEGYEFLRGAYDHFLLWSILGAGAGGFVPITKRLIAYRRHRDATNLPRSEGMLRKRFLAPHQRQLFLLKPVLERIKSPIATQLCTNPSLRSDLITHWQARCDLPRLRPLRLRRVMRELAGGRYHRFSSGLRTAVKDLVFDQ